MRQLLIFVVGICYLLGKELLRASERQYHYHTFEDMTDHLKKFTTAYPHLTNLYEIGSSVLNRNLWVLEISAAPKHQLGVPNMKMIANIHGNEPVGKEMLLILAEFLLINYRTNETIQWLVNTTRLHLLPSLNPDGFESAHMSCDTSNAYRGNSRYIDLNTNFRENIVREKETEAVIKWLQSIPFILSASLHDGALMVTYPFDRAPMSTWDAALELLMTSNGTYQDMKRIWQKVANVTGAASLTPDDNVFQHIATEYSSTHPHMHKGLDCNGLRFENGVVNGAKWQNTFGTMQDYNYIYHGCLELTLIISCCRFPKNDKLAQLWEENKEALLEFIGQVHTGVQGLVFDKATNFKIHSATLQIIGKNVTFNTSRHGEYWRILRPGKYHLQVKADGYKEQVVAFDVVATPWKQSKMTWLDVYMIPSSLEVKELGNTKRNQAESQVHKINARNTSSEPSTGDKTQSVQQPLLNSATTHTSLRGGKEQVLLIPITLFISAYKTACPDTLTD